MMERAHFACRAALAAWIVMGNSARAGEPDPVLVEVEEELVAPEPARNGAGPLWCYGAPLLVREGARVYASVLETGAGVPPLCNTRWQLWRREDRAGKGEPSWTTVATASGFREREPCPIVSLGEGRIAISVNPSTEPPGTEYGACAPGLVVFSGEGTPPLAETISWEGRPRFTDHSYRAVASDAARGEVLVLHIDAETSRQHVALRERDGRWRDCGAIEFPIRAAYPQLVYRDGTAHVLAIGDIVEPNAEWRALKLEKTASAWDYVFRRLFYASTGGVREAPVAKPIEVATVEATGGHIQNLDLHVDAKGSAHLLYLVTSHQHGFLRDRYFPGARMTRSLEYARVEAGEVVARRRFASADLESPVAGSFSASWARFHVDARGGLSVVMAASEIGASPAFGNFWARLAGFETTGGEAVSADGANGTAWRFHRIPLASPFGVFFTATPRGGSAPSSTLDLFGVAPGSSMLRYARARLPQFGVTLSTEGSGRATGYAESTKIVTFDGRTHVAWLDSVPGERGNTSPQNSKPQSSKPQSSKPQISESGFRVRVRTLDRKSGEWSAVVTIGEAADNHGGPALAVDGAGYLHVLYYPHHHPMRYRRSRRPNDASEWTDAEVFGQRSTYPTLLAHRDGRLIATVRESFADRTRPWEVQLFTRAPDGAWEGPRAILRSEHSGYSHFQEALAWGAEEKRLHLSARIYSGEPRRGHTVGYLRSDDRGETWTRADGTPVELPARADDLEVLAQDREGAGVGLRAGNIAVDREGRAYVIYSSYDESPLVSWLARIDPDGRITRRRLNDLLPRDLAKSGPSEQSLAGQSLAGRGLTVPGAATFTSDGRFVAALTLISPPSLEDATIWGHPSSEVVLLSTSDPSSDGGWRVSLVEEPDPRVPRWLPNLERPTATGYPVHPSLLYTVGERGASNSDILANDVRWLEVEE